MKLRNKKGFTIVELVIVIAIIAILAAVLIPTFSTVIEKANISSALQEAKNAIELVSMERKGTMGTMYVVSGKYVFKYTDDKGLEGDPVYTGTATTGDNAETAEANAYAKVKKLIGSDDSPVKPEVVYGKTSYSASSTTATALTTWGSGLFALLDKDDNATTNVADIKSSTFDGVKFVSNADISTKVLVCATTAAN